MTVLALVVFSNAAHAACANPAGNEGDMVYNAEIRTLTYCDGTKWQITMNQHTVPVAGLIGHWTFGDGSGTTAIDSAGGNNGTLTNGPVWASGQLGGALSFDGSNDFVSFGTSFDIAGLPVTMTAWVNPSDYNDWRTIIAKRDDWSDAQMRFQFQLDNTTGRVRFDGGPSYTKTFAYSPPTGVWTHLTIVASVSSTDLYVNGTLNESLGGFTLGSKATAGSVIGASETSGEDPFKGKLDDVRIYNRALAAAEVQALYDLGVPDNDLTGGLIAHWPLDETAGTTAIDSAGSNNGTMQGGLDAGSNSVPGKIGTALDFDGTDDEINVGNPAVLDDMTVFSISLWVKPEIFGGGNCLGYRSLVQKNEFCNATGDGWNLLMHPDGALQFEEDRFTTNLYRRTGANFLQADKWQHIVVTWNGGMTAATDVHIYKDGVEAAYSASQDGSGVDLSTNYNFVIGAGPLGSAQFGGAIDDVRVYNRALSVDEVQALYRQKTLCANPAGLEGDLFYNADNNVLQWCGGKWHAAGPVPGAGGAGCSNPAGARGDLIYNADYRVPIYCDGAKWINVARSPITKYAASRMTMGASLSGNVKWDGGVLATNNKIYGIPQDATDILIIDPLAGTATRSNMGADLTGTMKWIDGVLGPDGKIYGIPLDATDILIIDPVAGTATRSNMGADLSGSYKWAGGALGPDGKIYGIPYNATDILIIDPVAGTATRSAMGATLTGGAKWESAVLAPNGKIYAPPTDATDILIIDPVAGTATRSNMGATLTGSQKWWSAALGPDGRIYGIPADSADILIIDPVAGTATRSNMGANLSGGTKWYGGVLAPDDKIYGIPQSATDVLVIDVAVGTAYRTPMGADLSGSAKWATRGLSLGPDGRIYGIPSNSNDILVIEIPR